MKDRPYLNKTYRFQFYIPRVVFPVPTLTGMALTMLRTLMTTTMAFWMWTNVAEPAGTLCKQQPMFSFSIILQMQRETPAPAMLPMQFLLTKEHLNYCYSLLNL